MNDYKGKSWEEMGKMLADRREALRVFRFEMSGSKIKNVSAGRSIRADIARILTERNTQRKS